MTTYASPVEQVDEDRLVSLVTDQVREGQRLEYKEALPRETGPQRLIDDDKQEFLADVSAFANSTGGDLIFGIRERRENGKPTGEPVEVVGLPGTNIDAVCLRLGNILRDGIEPRLPGVRFHEVRCINGASCLLLRIPRSWAGLHMVTYKGLRWFYSRSSSGKYPLDVEEIRTGFRAAEAASERVHRFRAQRIAMIVGGEAPIPLGTDPKLIFHAVPLGSVDAWNRFRALQTQDIVPALRPIASAAIGAYHFNLDGFLVRTHRRNQELNCYVQLFRDGGIEAVSVGVITGNVTYGGFYGSNVERQLIDGLRSFQKAWELIGIESPITMGMCLTGVRGQKLLPRSDRFGLMDVTLPDEVMVFPDVLSDDVKGSPDVILRPIIDLMWNAGGWPESPHYRDGRWVDRE